jgi:hypothetical protein
MERTLASWEEGGKISGKVPFCPFFHGIYKEPHSTF